MKKIILLLKYFLVQPRRKTLIAALFVLVISLLCGRQISLYNESLLLDEKHDAVRSELDIYGNALTINLNSYFGLFEGIHGFIDTENSFPTTHVNDTFNHLATKFYERESGIRNFSVAPGGVQMYVYPLEGNENVLGHDLINDERPEVRVDVARAIETRGIVLSGPYELRQSGLGLVARQAVYAGEDFWGLVAMVVDVPPILTKTGLSENNEYLAFALQDKNGDVFWGESDVLNVQPLQYQVVLPDGYWTLSAAPRGGWDGSSPRSSLIQIGVVLILTMLALLTYLLVNRDDRLQHNVAEKTLALSHVVTELEASEKKYRELVELAQEGIWVIDKDSVTVFVNPSMGEILGYECEEMIGKELFSFMDEQGIEIARKNIERRKEGIAEQHDFEFIRKDGEQIIVTMETAPIMDENGQYAGAVAGVIDITERKRIEQHLQESEKRFRSLFRDSADAYLILDENIFVDCNQATVEMLRASSKEEVLSMHPSQLSPEFQPDGRSSAEKADEMIGIVLEQGSNRFEWIHRRMDGEDFPVEVLLTPIVVGAKTIIYTTWRDITERKNANEMLQENEKRLRRYFDQQFLGMAVTSVDRRWVEVNDALCEMFGYSREELLNLTWVETTYPEDLDSNLALFEKALAGEIDSYSLDKRFLRKDGGIFYAELSISVIRKGDGSVDYLITLIDDITERKEAEATLQTLNNELDERVEKRTKELNNMVMLMSGREIRMAELKKVITTLRTQLKESGIEPLAFDPLLGPDKEW